MLAAVLNRKFIIKLEFGSIFVSQVMMKVSNFLGEASKRGGDCVILHKLKFSSRLVYHVI
jgi:hypothetical protein